MKPQLSRNYVGVVNATIKVVKSEKVRKTEKSLGKDAKKIEKTDKQNFADRVKKGQSAYTGPVS